MAKVSIHFYTINRLTEKFAKVGGDIKWFSIVTVCGNGEIPLLSIAYIDILDSIENIGNIATIYLSKSMISMVILSRMFLTPII